MTTEAFHRSVRDLVRPDGVGSVWCEGHEIVRRIFVTVRDKHWKEVAPTHWESEIDEAQHTATLTARHISDSVVFEWSGSLRVSDDLRHVRFQIAGRVLQDMEVCRLGLVVLHPVESLVGSELAVFGRQAGHRLTVAQIIAPQPIVNGVPQAMTEPFSKLLVERADFGGLELQFEGDLFELEDQRNWGDASFKTYCTPLRLGFPRVLKAGASITHSVEVHFRPSSIARVTEERPAALFGKFPRIGREWQPSSSPQPASHREPRWHHLHFEAEGREYVTALQALLESATSPKIQIGIEARDDNPPPEMLTLLSAHRERISQLLLYGPRTSLPSADSVERWQRQIEALNARPHIPMLLATRAYFVEFNRGVELGAPVSGIAFPLTATVHADDAETIRDNVPAIRDIVATARTRTGLSEIGVAPLALYHPRSATPQKFASEWVAPWLTATLINAALARVASVTLAADVLESIDSSGPYTSTFLSYLVECGDLEVMTLEKTLPPNLHAVVLRSGAPSQSRVLVANVSARSASLSLAKVRPRKKTATDFLTGASFEFSTEHLDIPGFSVTWIR